MVQVQRRPARGTGKLSNNQMRLMTTLCILVAAASLMCALCLVSQRTQAAFRVDFPSARQRRNPLRLSASWTDGLTQPVRLRGGAADSETESETETDEAFEGSVVSKGSPLKQDEQEDEDGGEENVSEEKGSETENAETKEDGEDGKDGEASEDAEANKRPPPTPEMIRAMNERLWEASLEGNEPLAQKAIDGGANVNAFCRGPDKWVNISIGELAGADDAHTGLNVHWMELNNYTAIHLAAASGNAAVIDKLLEAGADINVECLQRVHPFPQCFGGHPPFASLLQPVVYKCTPLRLARASNCGRCFFTSYQKSVDKLEAAKAVDNDLHFPFNTVVLGMALGGAWLGLKQWPFNWFSEWPSNWADYPDMAPYLDK